MTLVLEDSEQSLLVAHFTAASVFVTAQATSEGFQMDLDEPVTRVVALVYDRSLSELLLTSGPVPLAGSSDEWRPLPAADRILSTNTQDPHWQELSEFDTELESVRLLGSFVEACIETGGCLERGGESCLQPCPEPEALVEPDLPIPTESPSAPDLLPCPAGWRVVGATPPVCEPWPESGHLDCPTEEVFFPGSTGCTLIGSDCGVDGWPENPPPDREILYVRPGAQGGVGTRELPFGSIETALAASSEGALFALSTGEHVAPASITGGRSLLGACVQSTVVVSPMPGLMVAGAAELRNLTIRSPHVGLLVASEGDLRLTDVAVAHVGGEGIVLLGGHLSGKRVRVESPGWDGIRLEGGSTAELQQLAIEGSGRSALRVESGSTLRVGGASIRASAESDLTVSGGAAVVVEDSVLEQSPWGVDVVGADSRIEASHLVIREGAASTGESGLNLSSGARAILSKSWVEGRRTFGISLSASTATVSDTLVRSTLPGSDPSSGQGVMIVNSFFSGTRLRIDDSHWRGLVAFGERTDARVQDVEVTGSGALLGGSAVDVSAGAFLASRLSILANAGGAMEIRAGARTTLTDLRILDTQNPGRGLLIENARVTIDRALISENGGNGITVGMSMLDLRDVEVSNNVGTGMRLASSTVVGERIVGRRNAGRHLLIRDGGQSTLREVTLLDVQRGPEDPQTSHGIEIYDSEAELQSLRVVGSQSHNIFMRGQAKLTLERMTNERAGGSGVFADVGAERLVMRSFSVSDSRSVGLQVSADVEASAEEGIITGNPVGLSVPRGFDLAKVVARVSLSGNERPFDRR